MSRSGRESAIYFSFFFKCVGGTTTFSLRERLFHNVKYGRDRCCFPWIFARAFSLEKSENLKADYACRSFYRKTKFFGVHVLLCRATVFFSLHFFVRYFWVSSLIPRLRRAFAIYCDFLFIAHIHSLTHSHNSQLFDDDDDDGNINIWPR